MLVSSHRTVDYNLPIDETCSHGCVLDDRGHEARILVEVHNFSHCLPAAHPKPWRFALPTGREVIVVGVAHWRAGGPSISSFGPRWLWVMTGCLRPSIAKQTQSSIVVALSFLLPQRHRTGLVGGGSERASGQQKCARIEFLVPYRPY